MTLFTKLPALVLPQLLFFFVVQYDQGLNSAVSNDSVIRQ